MVLNKRTKHVKVLTEMITDTRDIHLDLIISRVLFNNDYCDNPESYFGDLGSDKFVSEVLFLASMTLNEPITQQYIIARCNKLKVYIKQLENVKKIPVLTQRTPEWTEARLNMLTASNFAEALNLGKFGCQRDLLIQKIDIAYKCFGTTSSYTGTGDGIEQSIMAWGTMFEKVAQDIYCNRNDVEIYEFGLIQHPVEKYIGASPDGINSLGIMLEIKCPPKRIITGIIPDQYLIQMQGQLEVCDLEECDYLECKFMEYANESAFLADTSPYNTILTVDLKEKGIIIKYRKSKGQEFQYHYTKVCIINDAMQKWRDDIIASFDLNIEYEILYWHLEQYSCQRIKRDKELWKTYQDNLKFIWGRIEYYRDPVNKTKYITEVRNNKKRKIFEFDDTGMMTSTATSGTTSTMASASALETENIKIPEQTMINMNTKPMFRKAQ